MAIACLRLFTFPPLPPLPDLNVPCFLRFIALSTVWLAPLLYRRPRDLRGEDLFFAGMHPSLCLEEKHSPEVFQIWR